MLRDIRVGTETSGASHLLSHNGNLYFVADDGANGTEVWRSVARKIVPSCICINPTDPATPVNLPSWERRYTSLLMMVRGVEIWFLAESEDIHLASN